MANKRNATRQKDKRETAYTQSPQPLDKVKLNSSFQWNCVTLAAWCGWVSNSTGFLAREKKE